MKTLKTIISSALLTSFAAVGIAQAAPMSESELYDVIHTESADIFTVGDYRRSTDEGVVSLGDDYNKNSVWSVEFQEYINPGDLQKSEISSIDDVNQYLSKSPTAAGSSRSEVFIYDETAGDFQLQ